MTLALPQSLIDEMVAHAEEDEPNECCGVIGRAANGAFMLWRATNDDASEYRFTIPPEQVLHLDKSIDRVDGVWLVIYHSHVKSEARPSPTDLRMARYHKGLEEWPYWVLVSLEGETPSVRAWRIDEGDDDEALVATEIDLVALDGDGVRSKLEMVRAVRERAL